MRTMLDRAQVLHVARLARLELDDAEVERMAGELSAVLEHFERIRELDLEGVPPTSHAVDVNTVLRPDEPVASLPRDAILAAAPEPVDGGFGVPSPGPANE
jgi:aspartyl-tRNA(Asn)/glutamyl-tRNA(Gln) amidotransferase subunit C